MSVCGLPYRAWLRVGVLVCVLMCSIESRVAIADELPELGESAQFDMPPELERKIGESIMNEIRLREPAYIDDPEITDYLNRLGQRIVAASDHPTSSFYFFGIRDNAINAFAMFGGFIGVNSGTLLAAESESELAGVMAHEVAHVTQNHLARQIAAQKRQTVPALVALAVGILAARSNSSAAAGIITSTQAGMIQSQLAYTRDFEREADRVGLETLRKAGFDVNGMSGFFERLQKASRLYEMGAPVYLRSHPLTVERLSDIQNRTQNLPYRQVLSSLDFYLVRAKLRAFEGTPQEAFTNFETLINEKKSLSEPANHYGLAIASLRAKEVARAQKEVDALKGFKNVSSPMLTKLFADVCLFRGDSACALREFQSGVQRFPFSKALSYGYVETLYSLKRFKEAQLFIDGLFTRGTADAKLYALQARNFAAQGKILEQHRYQAEAYVLEGRLSAAITQLQEAQKGNDGNFYEQSVVDARLRELKKMQEEEARLRAPR